jgi:hypothetical protein
MPRENSEHPRSRASPPSPTTAGRLQWLVDRLQGGKTSVAALAWSVDRPTLSRVLSGKVRKPRGDFLYQIAQASGTTVEWLLTGEGDPPALPTEVPPSAVVLKALALADHLAIPAQSREMLTQFWGGFVTAARVVTKVEGGETCEPSSDVIYMARKADEAVARAWARFLAGFAAAYPIDRAQALFANVGTWQAILIAMNPTVTRFVTELAQDDRVPKDVIADIVRRTFGTPIPEHQSPQSVQTG